MSEASKKLPHRWARGESGNPTGRPPANRDIGRVARIYGPACIDKLAQFAGLKKGGKIAETEAAQIGAIRELLDRGYGKPTQEIKGDDALSLTFLHLVAMRSFSNGEIQPTLLEGEAETVETNVSTPPNLMEPATE